MIRRSGQVSFRPAFVSAPGSDAHLTGPSDVSHSLHLLQVTRVARAGTGSNGSTHVLKEGELGADLTSLGR
jgi:hypothetical protein